MSWRTTQIKMDQHVFIDDVPEYVNWACENKATGTIVVGMRNAQLCVRNATLDIIVRVRDDVDNIDNEHQILSVLNDISGKTVRSIE